MAIDAATLLTSADHAGVPAPLTDEQERVWHTYRRMQAMLASQMNRQLIVETGLSDADFEILAALRTTCQQRARALALRCAVNWEKSRLSHQLTRMQQRGLVIREDCVEDSRGAVYRLTEAGRAAVDGAVASRTAAVRAYLVDILTPEQLAALGEISEVILARLGGDTATSLPPHGAVEQPC